MSSNQEHRGKGDNVITKIINYSNSFGVPNWVTKILLFGVFGALIIILIEISIFFYKNSGTNRRFETKKMIQISGGQKIIGKSGNNIDDPAHRISLSPYWIDKYEVTVKEYVDFCKKNGYSLPPDPDFKNLADYFTNPKWADYPVVNVTWYEAKKYCECQNKRLPTEAEWENAARNQNITSVNQFLPEEGNNPDSSLLIYYPKYIISNSKNDDFPFTSSVGFFKANQNGLFDLNGNVAEWCLDSYEKMFYLNANELNPVNHDTTINYAVVRGTSWLNWNSGEVTKRNKKNKNQRYNDIGFRCASSVNIN